LFGIGFFVLVHSLSQALINASPILLIANTINAASAVPYSITQRLLGASSLFTMSLMLGISVAVGEAWHRRDFGWIQRTINRSEIMVLFSGILPLVLFLFAGQAIVLWWTKSTVAVPSFYLLLACVLLSCATSIGDIYSNFFIAMNHVRFIAMTRFIAGVVLVLSGYVAGVMSQSPTLIAFIQFSIGALIPTVLFWGKMKKLLLCADFSKS
jgi:O-antigen/teichoic acid export membrane protein